MTNETDALFSKSIRHILIAFVVGLLIGAGVFFLATRGQGNSQRIVQELQAENRELKECIGSIQTAVDSVGAGIESAAGEAGDIADGIGSVIAGLDDSVRILGELSALFDRITEILASGESPRAP